MDISKEEEATVLLFYQMEMLRICDDFSISLQLQSTAITYFKMVFMKKRVFLYDMDNFIVACILLAMKVENIFMTALRMKEKLAFPDVNLVAAYELDICNILKFNLHVPSPHLRLLGLFLLLKNKEKVNIQGGKALVQTQQIKETDETLDWNQSIRNLRNLMLLDDYHTLDLNHVAMASLPVHPSSLEGFFMEDTIEAVKNLKKKMTEKEKPSISELKKINRKIEKIQKAYDIKSNLSA